MKRCVLSLLLFILPSLCIASTKLVEIQTPKAHELAHALTQIGFDVAGHHSKAKKVSVVTQDEFKLVQFLNKHSIPNKILSIVPARPFREFRSKVKPGYYDEQETVDAMKRLAYRYPKWASLIDLNQLLGLPVTANGHSLYALQVSQNPNMIEDEPKVLYVGQHHAREITTHHIVLDAAESLLRKAQNGDARSEKWIETTSIWFVPLVNPDGLQHVFDENRMWRKNRKQNSDGSVGVDLNRNYGFKWGECGTNSPIGSSQVFKGESAHSETEVQIMDRLNEKLRVQYLISFHSYGDEVLYPYICGTLAEEEVYYGIRDELADLLNFGIRHASSSGEDFEHHYAKYGSLSFLVEVGSEFQPDFEHYQDAIAPNIQQTLPFTLEKLHERHVHFKVSNATTGEPVRAGLRLGSMDFLEGEIREADFFGSYRWVLTSGVYSLEVGAIGYEPKQIIVKAGGRTVDFVPVQLDPSPLFAGFIQFFGQLL